MFKIELNNSSLVSWGQIARASEGLTHATVSLDSGTWARIEASHAHLRRRIREEGIQVYGVTTGFGDNARRSTGENTDALLQKNLLEYLDCAFGENASARVSRATLLLRIICFSKGYSAVSPALVRALVRVFNAGYAPVLPLEGSLGASGDLIPLASIGRALSGQGSFYNAQDEIEPASQVLERLDLPRFEFRDKDGLGLVNGTSLMTAIAALALETTRSSWDWMLSSVAATLTALRAHPSAFSPLVNRLAKQHEGQAAIAERIRSLCGWDAAGARLDFAPLRESGEHEKSLQDSYGLRCVPQILGPCLEILERAEILVDREINSANDNPLVDPETGSISSGGNFYGGSIAEAMDQLAWANAHVADLLDRQILLMVDESSSRGLPPNLSGAHLENGSSSRFAHHGMKGLHQYATSLTAEIVRLAVPASIFSRSTESHNQDKISLGTHSARNALRSLDLLGRLTTIHVACSAQALELSERTHQTEVPIQLRSWLRQVRERIGFLKEDRPLSDELRSMQSILIRSLIEEKEAA